MREVRNKGQHLMPHEDMRREAGDVLLVEGAREDVLKAKDTAGAAGCLASMPVGRLKGWRLPGLRAGQP